jgi:YfiH family protein
MKRVETTAGPLYQVEAFSEIAWLGHGFGTRGVALDNYVSHFGLKGAAVARTNQTHGSRIHVLDGEVPAEILQGDAFATQSPNVVCFVRTADCVPILLCDAERHAVGAVHAGWRGHVCDVIGHTVRTMQDKFGSDASKLFAAIGPSICPECYTVGEEVIESFVQNGFADRLWHAGADKKSFSLNLKRASEELLISAGLARERITTLPLCTSCSNGDFASYRRERSEKSRQVNFIYVK